MTVLELLQSYILPIGGIIGGMSAVIVFVFGGRQRRAEIAKIKAGTDEMIVLRPAKLQQMITETSEKIMSAQNGLIEDLHAHLARADEDISKLQRQLDLEIGSREEIIEELKKELAIYQEENAQLRADNKKLNEKIADQQKEIEDLKIRITQLDQYYRERNDGC